MTKVEVRIWRVPSRRNPRHKHKVVRKGKKFGCRCLGFIYSDHKTPCFHIKEVKAGKYGSGTLISGGAK